MQKPSIDAYMPSAGSRGTRIAFFSVMLAIYLTLEFALSFYVVRWDRVPSVALFSVLSVLFLGAAYGTTRELVSLKDRPPLPSVQSLASRPRVALLYTTMNDVVPECLASMAQDYPSDVYVLDDSTNPEAMATVDRVSSEQAYTVERRTTRRGYKAGAINDWLAKHWGSYDYVVLFDADSYLPPDWVGRALRYAEHPANGDVAIFQGLINIWNLDTDFAAALAPMSKLGRFVWERNLANSMDAVFCYGHNVLVRVSALKQIGGFVEGYVSEDFATAVCLAQKGWHSKFIPLHTYEAVPENVRGFIRRQNKWTRGSMEFWGFASRPSISADKGFHLLQTPMSHVVNLILPLGAFLTVYGFASTPAAAGSFLISLLRNPLGIIWSIPILRLLIIWGLVGSALGAIIRYRAGVTTREYLRHRFLSGAISTVMMPYELRSMASYFMTGLRSIPVTPKSEKPLSHGDVLHISSYSLVFQGVLWIGVLVFNPLGAVFNSTWLVPMLMSPFVLMLYSGYGRKAGRGLSDSKEIPVSAVKADPFVVHEFLSTVVTKQEAAPPALVG
ncbi:MAG TPA: glycosyltransferase family 2 protein [Nitrososphaerales archaeon]|nr:glycosyltransferase family 2 protein [Nitrososphaerales archaeon]